MLVAVSGGESSVALAHLLQEGTAASHKKLLFCPQLVWVDEGAVLGFPEQTRRQNTAEAVATLGKFGFSVHVALLEDYNSDTVRVFAEPGQVSYSGAAADSLAATFGRVRDRSGRQELLLQLRRGVLLGAARSLGCRKLLTGDTATRLAVELMASVASGVGGGLPHRVGFRDNRDTAEDSGGDGVVIFRPMRELSSKEASLYCRYQQLDTWHGQEVQGAGGTIREVTQEFLVGLQDSFPSTIPTVNRTGDKLAVAGGEDEGGGGEAGEAVCCLCQSRLDTDAMSRHNALQATQYSSYISAGGQLQPGAGHHNGGSAGGGGGEDTGCCGEGDGSCQTRSCQEVTLEEVMEALCYTCRRTFDKIDNIDDIPISLLNKVKMRKRRNQMKDEISDFLL